jgi:DNA polymerase-3 subunit gamma/tau
MILAGDISSTLSIVKELTDRGSDLRQLTKELVETFRNIAVVKITPDAEDLLEFPAEEVERLRSLTDGIGIEPLTLILSELLRLEGEVRNAINPRYTLELGLLRMSFVKGMTSIESVLKKLGDAPSQPEPTVDKAEIKQPLPAVTEKKSELTEEPAASTPSKLPSKEEVWRDLLKHLDTEDHLLYGKLAEARPVHLTATELSIGFNGGMAILADSIKSKMSVIKPMLKTVSGHNLRLKIVSLPDDKLRKDIKEIKEEVYTEPIVQDAMKIFNGSVLKVKPLEDDGSSE